MNLRLKAEHRFLNRIITDLDNGIGDKDLTPEQVCKYLQGYCELRKQDAAREKNVVALHVASVKEVVSSKTPEQKKAEMGLREPAPYGRKDDGTPYTHAEFRAVLTRSVRDIYGLPMPDDSTANAAWPMAPRPTTARQDSAPAIRNSPVASPPAIAQPAVPPSQASESPP